MKKLLSTLLFIGAIFIAGCNSTGADYYVNLPGLQAGYKSEGLHGVSYKIPSGWAEINNDPWTYYYPDLSNQNNMLMVTFEEIDWSQVESFEDSFAGMITGVDGGSMKVLESEVLVFEDIKGTEVSHIIAEHKRDDKTNLMNIYGIPADDGLVSFWFEQDGDFETDYEDNYIEILESITADVNVKYKNDQ